MSVSDCLRPLFLICFFPCSFTLSLFLSFISLHLSAPCLLVSLPPCLLVSLSPCLLVSLPPCLLVSLPPCTRSQPPCVSFPATFSLPGVPFCFLSACLSLSPFAVSVCSGVSLPVFSLLSLISPSVSHLLSPLLSPCLSPEIT